MKNALVLVGIWVGIILFAYSVVYLAPDRSFDVTWAGDAETMDALHGFSFPLPPGWAYRSTDRVGVFVPPVAGIEVWAVAVTASTVEEALAAAWEAIDPCSSCERSLILDVTPLGDRDGATLGLGPDGEGWTGRAVVLLLGDSTRVLLVRLAPDGTLPARVQSDLTRIEAGFRALEMEAPPVPDVVEEPAA